MEISQQKYQLQHMLISVTNPDKQPRKQARSEEGQTTSLSTKMVTEKKNSGRNTVPDCDQK